MAKIIKRRKTSWIVALLFFGHGASLLASSIGTQLGIIAGSLAGRMNDYAAKHNGEAPRSWDDLRPVMDFEATEISLGAPIQSKMIFLGDNRPAAEGDNEGRVIAMTAFPIDEDRRDEIGRYIVTYQQETGKFQSGWESERAIQRSFAAAGIYVPPAAVYQEKLLKPLEFGYSARLIEDAVTHGVPMEEAEKVVEKHVNDVSNRRAKPATTWAEIAPATSATPTPDQSQTSAVLPRPASPNAQTPAAPIEQRALVWPWVVGIGMMGAIALLIWKRRF